MVEMPFSAFPVPKSLERLPTPGAAATRKRKILWQHHLERKTDFRKKERFLPPKTQNSPKLLIPVKVQEEYLQNVPPGQVALMVMKPPGPLQNQDEN